MPPGLLTSGLLGHPATERVFSDETLIGDLLAVEAALATAEARVGLVPAAAAEAIVAAVARTEATAQTLKAGTIAAGVPVPALVKALKAAVGPEHAAWVHFGATSQDIVDTAFVLAYARVLDAVEPRLSEVIDRLEVLAGAHAVAPMAGRTRSQLAAPITLGLRIAQWAQPLIALENDVAQVRRSVLKAQFGGAAGSRSAVGPHGAAIGAGLAEALGLAAAPPWHTDRSGPLRLAQWLGGLTGALGKMAGDLILSGRGEVAEIRAGSGGGSSTMPQKSNPVAAEAMVALARLAETYEAGLLRARVHAEERDGAMWLVEWALMPQICVAAAAALDHGLALLSAFEPDTTRMADRIAETPELLSEAAVFRLAERLGRAEAADLVKAALDDAAPFDAALAGRLPEGIAAADILDPAPLIRDAMEVARSIFEGRARRGRGG